MKQMFECSGTIRRLILSCPRVRSPALGLLIHRDERSTPPSSSPTRSPQRTGKTSLWSTSPPTSPDPHTDDLADSGVDVRLASTTAARGHSWRGYHHPLFESKQQVSSHLIIRKRFYGVDNAGEAKHLQRGEPHQLAQLWESFRGESRSAAGTKDQC